MAVGLQDQVHSAIRQSTAPPWRQKIADYWTLTKPEVNFLVLVSTMVGFYLGSPAAIPLARLIHTLLGTLMVASGTGTLNQYFERHSDALMRRTARRPLPSGRLRPAEGLTFGLLLAFAGGAYLALTVNLLTSALALLTLVTYLAFYTPLKRRSALCTLVGAFPGAMPPLIGWAGARGGLSAEAWVLYSILFLWQFPHFLAIAWMYREDYARAGCRMLPANDVEGRKMALQIAFFSLLLLPVSLIPSWLGQAGILYMVCTAALGITFAIYALQMAWRRSNMLARRLVLVSVIYLPLVFVLMMADKIAA
jgi:protoheme IX farnesyltransferase